MAITFLNAIPFGVFQHNLQNALGDGKFVHAYLSFLVLNDSALLRHLNTITRIFQSLAIHQETPPQWWPTEGSVG